MDILKLLAKFISAGVFDNVTSNAADLRALRARARLTCKAIYFLIEVSFANNHENSMYVARLMDVMIKHVDMDVGSDRCLTQMLDNNEQLLNEKVHDVDMCALL